MHQFYLLWNCSLMESILGAQRASLIALLHWLFVDSTTYSKAAPVDPVGSRKHSHGQASGWMNCNCAFELKTECYVPSGKRLHNELERFTIFNGKTHYFDWAIFNSYVKLPEGNRKKCVSFVPMCVWAGHVGWWFWLHARCCLQPRGCNIPNLINPLSNSNSPICKWNRLKTGYPRIQETKMVICQG